MASFTFHVVTFIEQVTGFEPATLSLARTRSAVELHLRNIS